MKVINPEIAALAYESERAQSSMTLAGLFEVGKVFNMGPSDGLPHLSSQIITKIEGNTITTSPAPQYVGAIVELNGVKKEVIAISKDGKGKTVYTYAEYIPGSKLKWTYEGSPFTVSQQTIPIGGPGFTQEMSDKLYKKQLAAYKKKFDEQKTGILESLGFGEVFKPMPHPTPFADAIENVGAAKISESIKSAMDAAVKQAKASSTFTSKTGNLKKSILPPKQPTSLDDTLKKLDFSGMTEAVGRSKY